MAIQPGTYKTGASGSVGRVKLATAYYDFAVDGGAVGDIALRGDALPSGAIVVDALINVTTAVTGGASATLAIKIQGAADVQAAAAVTGAPWSTTGAKRASAVTATAAPITLSANRTITATVATAALTAGKFSVTLSYIEVV